MPDQGIKYASPGVASDAFDRLANTVEVLRLRLDALENAD